MKSTLIPFTPHFSKLIESGNQLVVQRLPHHPQNDPDIFLLGIGRQFVHVDFRNDLQHVPQLVPAFIENDVGQTVFRGKVDVILIRLRVDSSLEVHAVNIVEVPPVPSHFPWLDP